MDMLVIVAAAGAGCLAKYWKDFSTAADSNKSTSETSKCNATASEENSESSRVIREGPSISRSFNSTAKQNPSRSGPCGDEEVEEGNDAGIDCHENEGFAVNNCDPRSASGRGSSRSLRNRRRLSRGYNGKVMTAIESCLVAQLYREPEDMEECLFVSPRVRISGGGRLPPRGLVEGSGNKAAADCSSSLGEGLDVIYDVEEVGIRGQGKLIGMPSLPRRNARHHPREGTAVSRENMGFSNSRRLSNSSISLQGSFEKVLLFSFGVSVGVLSTILSSRREVDKLNDLLKQTENLVQDLEEELEMKDSLLVRELSYEACMTSEKNGYVADMNELAYSNQSYLEELEGQSVEYNINSMSRIEAELEAELERLEMNISSSSQRRQFSGLNEIDPDCLVDVVHGELREDMVHQEQDFVDRDPDDSNFSTPIRTENYAVSPRDLSLRLHQVIQSRLEERIVELELALQHSQKQVEPAEKPDRKILNQHPGFSSSDISTTPLGSPAWVGCRQLKFDSLDSRCLTDEEGSKIDGDQSFYDMKSDQQVVCHEAFDEFIKMAELERVNTIPEADQVTFRDVEEPSFYDDEFKEDEDEDGKLLIKSILEKARKGSPALQDARRILFSMHDLPWE